jgi:hypothetical protein
MIKLKLQILAMSMVSVCLGSVAAQSRVDCSQPVILRISLVNQKTQYELNGKTWKLYPLDGIADEMEHCWPNRPLFVIATWDVPLSVLSTPGQLQLDKVRYFVEGRNDPLFTEILYGRSYHRIPVTPDIAPIPEDNGTLHPPTKIPQTKGPQ